MANFMLHKFLSHKKKREKVLTPLQHTYKHYKEKVVNTVTTYNKHRRKTYLYNHTQTSRETCSHRQIHRDGKKKIGIRVEVGVQKIIWKNHEDKQEPQFVNKSHN